MTSTTTTTTTTTTNGAVYRSGHYVSTDHDRGEQYVAGIWHYVDREPGATLSGPTLARCGETLADGEYVYTTVGLTDAGTCADCRAALAALDVEPATLPAPTLSTFADYDGPMAAGTLDVDNVEHVTAGRTAVNAYRRGLAIEWAAVTLGAILSYWHHRHAAYWSDMRHVSRTLTAASRARGWEHYYGDYMGELADSLPAVVRTSAVRATAYPAHNVERDDTASRLATYAPMTPPAAIADIRGGTTVGDVLAAVALLETRHVDTLQDIGDAFLTAADDNDWCTDYERAVLDVVAGLSTYSASLGAFRGREREREYVVDVQITETRYVSVTVTAADEDSAADYAAENWADYDDGYGERDVADVEIVEVNEA